MPRKPRFFLPDVPVHIVQRGHSRESVFFQDSDYQAYLDWLGEAAVRYDCALHAYVLMSNHIHLLVTPKSKASIGQMMQYIGRWYVPYFNHEYGSSGSIWEGRYKASLIDDEHYLLRCMRYIELNPVRANMVKTPGHYRWSSYRHNAQGKSNKLIRPHGIYTGLGRTKASRCEAYKALFKEHLEEGELEEIRAAWQTGTPLGDADFKAAIEKRLNTRVGQSRRGRPKKASNT
jgi:putative transposase